MTIHLVHHFPEPLETDPSTALSEIKKQLTKIMALLDDLQTQVARDTEVTSSAVLLLEGLKAKLDAAGTDPVKLKELSDQLGKNTDDLANAVAVNTPSA